MMESASSNGLFTKYRTLKEGEIRLLQLQPRRSPLAATALEHPQPGTLGLVEIECSFSLTNLDHPCPFEALSYVWGDPDAHIPVKIDGELVNITKNLSLALHYLRLDDAPRTLWVDALCINQIDFNERYSQVIAMRRIYERATSVVIFLGEAWDGHEIAIEFLQLASQGDSHGDPSLDPHITVRGHDITSDKLKEEVIHFFQLPWWDRVWVVQEYVLAKSMIFQIGNTLLAGDVVRQAFQLLAKHYWTCCAGDTSVNIPSPTYGLSMANALRRINTIDFIRHQQRKLSMLQLLGMFRTRKSYDARDKIYGILGMHFVPEIERVEPNYQISAEQLYIEFATQHIKKTGTLDVLHHAGHLNRGNLDVPSYVPDWTAPMSGSEHRHYASRGNALRIYNASGGRAAQFRVLDDCIISLKGVFLDKIAVTGSIHNTETNSLALLEECRQMMAGTFAGHQAGAQSKNSIAYEDLSQQELTETPLSNTEERLWRILCGNTCIELVGNTPPPTIRLAEPEKDMAHYRAWQTWIAEEQPLGLPPSPSAVIFQQGLQLNTVARKFVMTDGGYVGFVPAASREGDVIVLFYGGKTPFVLRTTSLSSCKEACYNLIGDSYIDGIMQGEAVEASPEIEFLIS